jgi:hypothetical protein
MVIYPYAIMRSAKKHDLFLWPAQSQSISLVDTLNWLKMLLLLSTKRNLPVIRSSHIHRMITRRCPSRAFALQKIFPTLSSFQIHVMPFTLSQTQAHLLVIHMFFKSQIVYGIPFARLAIRNLEQRNRSKQNIYVYISTCCFAT